MMKMNRNMKMNYHTMSMAPYLLEQDVLRMGGCEGGAPWRPGGLVEHTSGAHMWSTHVEHTSAQREARFSAPLSANATVTAERC